MPRLVLDEDAAHLDVVNVVDNARADGLVGQAAGQEDGYDLMP
jgi:hypothetical protein